MRKAFNFYKSYSEVYFELSDKDKVQFMDALLRKQFMNIDPTTLTGMAKFAYLSQEHSIKSQVDGFISKMGDFSELEGVTQGGSVGGAKGGSAQEKEKEKEEDEIIVYLNQKSGKTFKCIETNRKVIRSRMNQGFTLSDFKKVIDTKVIQWKGKDMDKYLRPETLFGTKFEGYLNEEIKPIYKSPSGPFAYLTGN